MRFAGKKVLITGGNSGIGFATAKLFVAEGAEVAITGRNQETLDEAVKALGPKAVGFQGDITTLRAGKRRFRQLRRRFGKLDECLPMRV